MRRRTIALIVIAGSSLLLGCDAFSNVTPEQAGDIGGSVGGVVGGVVGGPGGAAIGEAIGTAAAGGLISILTALGVIKGRKVLVERREAKETAAAERISEKVAPKA